MPVELSIKIKVGGPQDEDQTAFQQSSSLPLTLTLQTTSVPLGAIVQHCPLLYTTSSRSTVFVRCAHTVAGKNFLPFTAEQSLLHDYIHLCISIFQQMDGFQFLDTASKAAETFLHKYFRDVHSLEGLGVELLAHYVQFYKKLPDISKWLEHCTCLPTMVECRHSTSCQHLILSVQFGHSGGCAVLPHCNLICTFLKTNDCG